MFQNDFVKNHFVKTVISDDNLTIQLGECGHYESEKKNIFIVLDDFNNDKEVYEFSNALEIIEEHFMQVKKELATIKEKLIKTPIKE